MPEQTYQRIDLAKEQLENALGIFLSRHSFVSALTLAGAAEEILGKALCHRGQKTTLQYEYPLRKPVEELFRKDNFTWKEFIGKKNLAKNAVKHMKNTSESMITVDLEVEAQWMIVRACHNYAQLGLQETPLMKEFDDWFYEHVIGLENQV